MGSNLYESIKIYEQSVNEALGSVEKPQPVEEDLASLVLQPRLRDTKKKPAHTIRLVDGQRYGFLTLNKKVKVRKSDRTRYQCKCKCKREVMLTRLEIQSRSRMRAGCLGFDCPYGADEVKAWHNPEFALWLQLRALLRACPEDVGNEWGGRAYDGIELVSFDEGFSRMREDLDDLLDVNKREWWLYRTNTVLPYSLFNIEIKGEPSPWALGGEPNYVFYANTLYSLTELSTLFGIPLNRVRRLRRKLQSDRELMELILEEASK